MRAAWLLLLFSALLNFAFFAKWPGNPDWDVHHSVFAAQNFITNGKLESINLYPEQSDNLALHTQLRWMTHWPPAHSWLYFGIMKLGLSAGAATKVLAVLSVILGGLGWVYLARRLGGSRLYIAAVAFAYPWLSFIARIYLDYKNDHVACALAPWIYLAIIRIESLKKFTDEQWGRLFFASLMAGTVVIVKYSLIPVLISSALYLLWLDDRIFTQKRILRLVIFSGVLLIPGVLLWSANHSLGETSYPLRPGTGLSLSLPIYAKNIIVNTFGVSTGWDLIFQQLKILFGISLFKGVVFFATLLMVIIWIVQFISSKWEHNRKSFGIYLVLLTGTLWAMLALMAVLSGAGYDYSSDCRFYIPIGFGWLLLCGLSLDKSSTKNIIWFTTFYSLIIPIIFSAVFFAAAGLFKEPFVRMPKSKTAWVATRDVSHAAFMSNLVAERGRKPDLLVANGGHYMTELGVPCFFAYRATRNDGHVYYSSVSMEVWAIVDPSDRDILLSKFSKALKSQQVNVPAGFPFIVYIFNF